MVLPVPVVDVRMSPKLMFVGVLPENDVDPLKVNVKLLVVPQVTEFVPLPDVAPALVIMPLVLAVKLSALATPDPATQTATSIRARTSIFVERPTCIDIPP